MQTAGGRYIAELHREPEAAFGRESLCEEWPAGKGDTLMTAIDALREQLQPLAALFLEYDGQRAWKLQKAV